MSPAWFSHFTTPPLVMVCVWVWNAGSLVKEALEGSQPSASWIFLQKTLIMGRCISVVEGDYGMHYRWRDNLIFFELVSDNLNYFTEKCYIDLYSWYFIYELDIFQILNDLYHQAPAVTRISRAGSRHRKYMQNQIFLTQGWHTNTNPLSLKKSPAELGLLLIGLPGSRKGGGGNHDCWEEPGSPSHGEPGTSGIAAAASLAF